jgi:hypothetical protein
MTPCPKQLQLWKIIMFFFKMFNLVAHEETINIQNTILLVARIKKF